MRSGPVPIPLVIMQDALPRDARRQEDGSRSRSRSRSLSRGHEHGSGGDETMDEVPDMTYGGSLASTSTFILRTPPSCGPGVRALPPPVRLMEGDDGNGDCAERKIGGEMNGDGDGDKVSRVASGMSWLLQSPPEILHRVLCLSGVEALNSVSSAAQTCKELRSFIYENPDTALWRDIFLRLYDDPRLSVRADSTEGEIQWKRLVQDRETVRKVFNEWPEERYAELGGMRDKIATTLLHMYLDLPSLVERQTTSKSSDSDLDLDIDDDDLDAIEDEADPANIPLLEPILRSPTFAHLITHHSTRLTSPTLRTLPGRTGAGPLRKTVRESLSPALARLHALLPPCFDMTDPAHTAHRGYLREVVYSAVNFCEANEWAPLDKQGKVDWVLVDAISSVMMANAKDVLSTGEVSWRPAIQPLSYGLQAVRGRRCDIERPLSLAPDGVWDWAGVEGKWCGSYAFLDYGDWVALNEPRIIMLRRGPVELDLSKYHEAVGDLLQMDLVIDRPTTSKSDHGPGRPYEGHDLPKVVSRLPTGTLLPPIHFHGASAQASGETTHPSGSPHSHVRGTVQLTPDDPPEVRWTIVIRYGGEDRWQVEGVQVGGRGSKRGFFGVWTDAAKEMHSPNGPAWYWRA